MLPAESSALVKKSSHCSDVLLRGGVCGGSFSCAPLPYTVVLRCRDVMFGAANILEILYPACWMTHFAGIWTAKKNLPACSRIQLHYTPFGFLGLQLEGNLHTVLYTSNLGLSFIQSSVCVASPHIRRHISSSSCLLNATAFGVQVIRNREIYFWSGWIVCGAKRLGVETAKKMRGEVQAPCSGCLGDIAT